MSLLVQWVSRLLGTAADSTQIATAPQACVQQAPLAADVGLHGLLVEPQACITAFDAGLCAVSSFTAAESGPAADANVAAAQQDAATAAALSQLKLPLVDLSRAGSLIQQLAAVYEHGSVSPSASNREDSASPNSLSAAGEADADVMVHLPDIKVLLQTWESISSAAGLTRADSSASSSCVGASTHPDTPPPVKPLLRPITAAVAAPPPAAAATAGGDSPGHTTVSASRCMWEEAAEREAGKEQLVASDSVVVVSEQVQVLSSKAAAAVATASTAAAAAPAAAPAVECDAAAAAGAAAAAPTRTAKTTSAVHLLTMPDVWWTVIPTLAVTASLVSTYSEVDREMRLVCADLTVACTAGSSLMLTPAHPATQLHISVRTT